MYCPTCGNQNFDTAKFCRACGLDLEMVALAVSNKMVAPSAWLEKYSESKSKVVTGAILAGIPLLIFFSVFLFVGDKIGLLVVWSFLLGWMAVWGVTKLATNVGTMVKAKTMLNSDPNYNQELPPQQQQFISANQQQQIQQPANYQAPQQPRYDTGELRPPSVTEHTTRMLDKK